ncbi:alpha/beta-hydrolase [Cadophora sp. DSE1049]|nr:alpha/beta-hydrolase [Cadophora sp. DSE1049]
MRHLSLLPAIFCFFSDATASFLTVNSTYTTNDSIRYKEFADGELCDGGQKHYVGWADIDQRHIFYWYHPARNNIEAPLMVWLQGGPGGSSVVGMLAEHGPCLVSVDGNSTKFNPYSWTTAYNIIYIDQPAGVGYSYVDEPINTSSYPRRSEESALDFLRVLRLLPDAFPELAGMPIHLAGESYAGRYVPEYAAAILEYNSRIREPDRIPLRSIMVGNGMSNMGEQWPALYDTGCYEHHGIAPIFNETDCSAMATAANRCEILYEQCQSNPDEIICIAAGKYCQQNLWDVVERKNVDRYNRNNTCPPGDCYPIVDDVETFMNSLEAREAFEIKTQMNQTSNHWAMTSKIIESRYIESGDFFTSSVPALTRVLEDPKVEVLYYVGVHDFACNSIGVRRMLENVKWSKRSEFRAQSMSSLPWTLSHGECAGMTKAVSGLDLVELNGGGHLVSFNQDTPPSRKQC